MAQGQLNAGSLGGRLLKRTIPQKVKPIPSCKSEREDMTTQVSQALPENSRRVRTSAAVIGLAVSMGAYGVPMTHQDQALAVDAPTGEPRSSDVLAPYETAKVFSGSGAGETQLSQVEHTVQEGQTLWDVARFYNIDAAAIAKANKLTLDSVLTVGQVIIIPADAGMAQAPTAIASSASMPSYYGPVAGRTTEPQAIVALPESEANAVLKAKQDKAVDVLKQKRESLRSSLQTLKQPPPVAPATSISPVLPQPKAQVPQVALGGQAETVNSNLSSVVPSATVAPQPKVPSVLASAATPQAQSVPGNPAQPNLTALRVPPQAAPSVTGAGTEYRVAPGDTLAKIAQSHGVSLGQLIAANNISNPNYIFVDQALVIPGAPSTTAGNPSFNGTAIASVAIPKSVDVSVPQPAVGQTFGAAPITDTKIAAGRTFTTPPQPAQAVDASPKLLRYNQIETLKTEIDQLRERYQGTSAPQSSVMVSTAPQAVKPSSTTVVEPVNPEFNPTKYSRVSGVRQRLRAGDTTTFGSPVSTTTPARPAEPKIVAAAPLGSANYDPIQAQLGQTVSPDMPPLGASSAYLPGSSSQIDGYMWPAKGVLTSPYGWRWGRMHKGIDIAGPVGTPIYAAADGRVSYAGWNSGGYGYLVEIEHPDGSLTLYAHNNRILVQVGQEVAQGQQISEMGSTGYSTGPHLHFEIHPAGKGAVNPMTYLARR